MDFLINIFKVKSFCFSLLFLLSCCELRPMDWARHHLPAPLADVRRRDPLYLAAINGNLDQIEQLLDSGEYDIDRMNEDPINVLYYAAAHGQKESFDALRSRGITLSSNLLLIGACRGGNVEIVRTALNKGADPNFVETCFSSQTLEPVDSNRQFLWPRCQPEPIFNALDCGDNVEVLKLLISRGANVNVSGTGCFFSYDGRELANITITPLKFAVLKKRSLDCLRIIIGVGSHIDYIDHDDAFGRSFRIHRINLDDAGDHGLGDLRHVQNYFEREARQTQALQHAVQIGDHYSALCALKAGAYVNIQDGEGDTPMQVATRNSDQPMMRLLLLFGPDLLVRNYADQTVFESENAVVLVNTMKEFGNLLRLFQATRMRQKQALWKKFKKLAKKVSCNALPYEDIEFQAMLKFLLEAKGAY